jgi:hypothetical protein
MTVRYDLQQGLMLNINAMEIGVFKIRTPSRVSRSLAPSEFDQIGRMYQSAGKWVIEGHIPDMPMGLMFLAIENMCEVQTPIGREAWEYAELFRRLEDVSARIVSVTVSSGFMCITFTVLDGRDPWHKLKDKITRIHDHRPRRETDADVEGRGCPVPAPEPAVAGSDSEDGQVACGSGEPSAATNI